MSLLALRNFAPSGQASRLSHVEAEVSFLFQEDLLGGKVGSGQQQQSGQKRPEHHADGNGEGPIDFLEIESWQQKNVGVFQYFGEKSHNDRRWKDGLRWNFPIRQ